MTLVPHKCEKMWHWLCLWWVWKSRMKEAAESGGHYLVIMSIDIPSVEEIYMKRCLKKAAIIIKDPHYPACILN